MYIIDFLFFNFLFFLLFYSLPSKTSLIFFFQSSAVCQEFEIWIPTLIYWENHHYFTWSNRVEINISLRDDWKNIHFSLAKFICWIRYVSNLTRKFRINSVHCIQFFPLTISSFVFFFRFWFTYRHFRLLTQIFSLWTVCLNW